MKLRNFIIAASVIGLSAVAQAEDIKVDTLRYAGPYAIRRPLMIDSTDVESNSFDSKKLLDSPIRLELVEEDGVLTDGVVSSENNEYALHLLGFSVTNKERVKVKLAVEGLKDKRIFVDGNLLQARDGKITLEPSTHKVVVKCLTMSDEADTLSVKVEYPDGYVVKIGDISGE